MATMNDTAATPTTVAGKSIYAALAGGSSWAREAREALRLARERGLHLDEGQVALSDVRDLQALVAELRLIPVPRAHVPRAAHRLRLYLDGCAAD